MKFSGEKIKPPVESPESRARQEQERLKMRLMKFAEDHITDEMWRDYVIGVDVSTVGKADREAKEEDRSRPCFVIYLKKRPPKSWRCDEDCEGIKVYWDFKTMA
ncbi:hypothetical protein HY772_05935 [Candidatus Woesearchaeota archaeon]|nr:hypothetical protein [Candidatus Woesearchaeota archaeon]